MTLADSRNTTYAPADPVRSNDLNELQDAVVQGAHGDRVLDLHPISGWPVTPANVALAGNGYLLWSAATVLWVPVPVHVGDRVKTFTYARSGDAAVDVTVTAYLYNMTDGLSILNASGSSLLDTNPAAAWADQAIDLTDTTIAEGETVLLKFDPNAGALRLGNIRVTYSHPLT